MSSRVHHLSAWLCAGLVLACGCTRSFWRRQADQRTYAAIQEHLNDPRWSVPRTDVTPDPRARFYSGYDPDREPLPPDDPAAHEYIHDLKLFPGAESWHDFGTALSIENPHWLAAFRLMIDPRTGETRPLRDIVPVAYEQPAASQEPQRAAHRHESAPSEAAASENAHETAGVPAAAASRPETEPAAAGSPATNGSRDTSAMPAADAGGIAPRHIDLPDLRLGEAIELGLIHSREYQTAIEDLYLAALALTFERFRFQVRYLGVANREPSGDTAISHTPGGDSQFSMNLRGGVRQLLPTGAQWAIELANNTLWVFTAGQSSTASVLSFSLTQPLLRNAGRKVTLENLTQAERDVLYAARTLARFRKQFFVELVGGQSGPGFLGLLQLRQTVLNQRNNVEQLIEQAELQRALASQIPSRIVEPLDALPADVQIPPDLPLQYDQQNRQLVWTGPMSEQQAERLRRLSDDRAFRDAIAGIINRARGEVVTLSVAQLESNLAASRNALRTAERQFQDALDRYKLQLGLPPDIEITIDESLLEPFRLIDPRLRQAELKLKDFVERWSTLQREPTDRQRILDVGNELLRLVERLERDGIRLLEEDFANVEAVLGLSGEPRDRQRPVRRSFETDAERQRVLNDLAKDRRMFQTLRTELRAARDRLLRLIAIAGTPNVPAAQLEPIAAELGSLREQFHKIAQGLQVVQIGVRVEQITLEPVQLDREEVVRLALDNRLDLMNQRAMVMDARRKIELAANELKAILDVQVEGDIGTSGGVKPFDFRGSSSNFRAGLAFDAPLDKAFQRNAYRASLIDYQRARRAYMAFEDQIKLQVRQQFRSLLIARRNFENARQAVRIAALQLDSAVEQATAPVQTGGQNQGLNLLNALRDVLNAQNDLIRFWVSYEQARLNLYRDMGLMEIDEEGIWTDPFYQQQTVRRRWTSPTPADRAADSSPPQQTRHFEGDAADPHIITTAATPASRPPAAENESLAPVPDVSVGDRPYGHARPTARRTARVAARRAPRASTDAAAEPFAAALAAIADGWNHWQTFNEDALQRLRDRLRQTPSAVAAVLPLATLDTARQPAPRADSRAPVAASPFPPTRSQSSPPQNAPPRPDATGQHTGPQPSATRRHRMERSGPSIGLLPAPAEPGSHPQRPTAPATSDAPASARWTTSSDAPTKASHEARVRSEAVAAPPAATGWRPTAARRP